MKKIKHLFHDSAGFTLIEVMISLLIIGLILGIGISVIFPGREAKLRDQSSRLAGTLKYLYNEAIVKNKYYRVVFDLDEGTYSVESREEPFTLQIHSEDSSLKSKPTPPPAEPKEGEEEGAPANPEDFTQEEGYLVEPTHLPKGIKFKDLYLMHLKDKVEHGKVEGYIFPQGWIEPMVVNLSDEDEEVFYSLEVNPITGTSKIRSEYYEVKPETYFPEEPSP